MICPVCNEYLLGNPDKCYKCGTNLQVTMSEEQIAAEQKRIQEEKRQQSEKRENERMAQAEKEAAERIRIQKEREKQILMNPLYEYDIVKFFDQYSGDYNSAKFQSIIQAHAQKRWRLAFVFTNEGMNHAHAATALAVIDPSIKSNTTIESITLIFERIIDLGNTQE